MHCVLACRLSLMNDHHLVNYKVQLSYVVVIFVYFIYILLLFSCHLNAVIDRIIRVVVARSFATIFHSNQRHGRRTTVTIDKTKRMRVTKQFCFAQTRSKQHDRVGRAAGRLRRRSARHCGQPLQTSDVDHRLGGQVCERTSRLVARCAAHSGACLLLTPYMCCC